MENTSVLSRLSERVLKRPMLWILDNYLVSIIVFLLILVFGIPFIQYLQTQVANPNNYKIFGDLWNWMVNHMTLRDYIFSIFLIILFFFIRRLYKHVSRMGKINENFVNDNFNKWSIPIGSEWTIQDGAELNAPGKVLQVTDSYFPGLLKEAYNWYDYEVIFQTRIESKNVPEDEQMFSIIVRAENSSTGVMFQITKKNFQPSIIYNGTVIKDSERNEKLPILLRPDTWIKIKIFVQGNNVDLFIDKCKLQYRIPSERYNVTSGLLSGGPYMELKDIKRNNDENQEKSNKVFKELRDAPKDENGLIKDFDSIISKFPSTTPVLLEFQKGSIGFRALGKECAYFRDLSVKKIG